jgi:hypothetical protein
MTLRLKAPLFTPHLLAAVLVCANASAATPASRLASSDAAFNDAMEQYREGRSSAAYGRFARLADQGHAEAARIALLMFRHGPKLYGHDWGASQPQLRQWMKLSRQRMDELKAESGD